ncbi:MAG: EAL domain-containing protein [Sphingobacteriia bacterium]|nr:EAL domain-containing protein [Sphingobacteriia bacterium]NCC39404.1 EAL domain-containing protein [Gammaproteobacteria bacterium]
MTTSPVASLTLLALTSESAEAERLVERLRELGLAARALVTTRAERLDDLLQRRAFDVVLWWSARTQDDIEESLARRAERSVEIPLIMICAQSSDPVDDLAKAKRTRARDLVAQGDDARLAWVIQRESATLRQLRRLRDLAGRLTHCERRALDLIDRAEDAILLVRGDQTLHVNPAFIRLLGFQTRDDALMVNFLDMIIPEQREVLRDLLRAADRPDQNDPIETRVRLRDTRRRTIEARLAAIRVTHDGGICLRITLSPDRLHAPASPSHGASGRATLDAEIELRLGPERSVRHPFAVFFVRVVRVNELLRDLGLTHGLALIDQLGILLAEVVEEPHIASRVSDDGFGLIIDGLDEQAAELLAERIRSRVRLPEHVTRASEDESDCVAGYYLVKGVAPAAEDILNAAHRLSVYIEAGPIDVSSGMQMPTSLAARDKQAASEDDDSELMQRIRIAIDSEHLCLVYQPIISLMGDSQESYSVLVRLLDEKGERVPAKDFIGTAIRGGFIEEIDRWTICTAVRALSEQRRAGHRPRFFINLAEDTFNNPSIILWICDCLRELDVRGNWLTFQFQEDTAIDNLESVTKLVEALKQIKCRIAISRFGKTERSEEILQALPIDVVVFMPEYARGLADDPTKQERLANLATLARDYKVASVVTGVEDARTLTVLWNVGVDYVQGNFLQRPSPTLELQP